MIVSNILQPNRENIQVFAHANKSQYLPSSPCFLFLVFCLLSLCGMFATSARRLTLRWKNKHHRAEQSGRSSAVNCPIQAASPTRKILGMFANSSVEEFSSQYWQSVYLQLAYIRKKKKDNYFVKSQKYPARESHFCADHVAKCDSVKSHKNILTTTESSPCSFPVWSFFFFSFKSSFYLTDEERVEERAHHRDDRLLASRLEREQEKVLRWVGVNDHTCSFLFYFFYFRA